MVTQAAHPVSQRGDCTGPGPPSSSEAHSRCRVLDSSSVRLAPGVSSGTQKQSRCDRRTTSWTKNLSAVSGAIRRQQLSGPGELGSPGCFRYSGLKEAVLESWAYGVRIAGVRLRRSECCVRQVDCGLGVGGQRGGCGWFECGAGARIRLARLAASKDCKVAAVSEGAITKHLGVDLTMTGVWRKNLRPTRGFPESGKRKGADDGGRQGLVAKECCQMDPGSTRHNPARGTIDHNCDALETEWSTVIGHVCTGRAQSGFRRACRQ